MRLRSTDRSASGSSKNLRPRYVPTLLCAINIDIGTVNIIITITV